MTTPQLVPKLPSRLVRLLNIGDVFSSWEKEDRARLWGMCGMEKHGEERTT